MYRRRANEIRIHTFHYNLNNAQVKRQWDETKKSIDFKPFKSPFLLLRVSKIIHDSTSMSNNLIMIYFIFQFFDISVSDDSNLKI